jgi:hypothetical protein
MPSAKGYGNPEDGGVYFGKNGHHSELLHQSPSLARIQEVKETIEHTMLAMEKPSMIIPLA